MACDDIYINLQIVTTTPLLLLTRPSGDTPEILFCSVSLVMSVSLLRGIEAGHAGVTGDQGMQVC